MLRIFSASPSHSQAKTARPGAALVIACAALLGVPGTTWAQAQAPASAALQERIATLERQLDALRRELAARPAPAAEREAAAAAAAPSFAEQLDALDQQVKVLARRFELEQERLAAEAKQAPVVDAGRNGLGLRSPDGAFQLRLRGLVQADSRVYLHDPADIAHDTLVARRVRPIVQATLFKQVEFRVTPDFGEGKTVLQDAQLDVRFHPAVRLRAGKFKAPFGLERLMSASDLVFIERASPTLVAPNRDIGLMLYGDLAKGALTYQAGVFNGVVDGGSADLDEQDGKDFVARLFAQPFARSTRTGLKGLGVGAAMSLGDATGVVASPNLPTYRTTGQQVFFRYRVEAGGTTQADGERVRYSLQGNYYGGPFGVIVEQAHSRQAVRRNTATADIGTNAWQAAATWVVTGERASSRGVAPRRVFDPTRGAWGAFEVAARYHQLVVDDEALPVFADPRVAARAARAWTAGLNWYLNPALKMVFDYEETRFEGGSPDGDRATARDFFTRLQVVF